ncbi:DNA polymerase [Methanosarcina sp. T3]|uniref:DNA polymerase n=1 Tax=Methanosarcina sp. T3 TaxID=3439062 RepID=UPI003F871893
MTTLYLDIETDNSPGYNGLDVFNGRIVTIQLLLPNGKTYIIKDPTQIDMDKIKPALESSLIVGHNLKFDCKFLKQQFGITLRYVYDTYIAEIALSGGVYASVKQRKILKIGLGLKDLVLRYCGEHLEKEEQTGFRYGVDLTTEQIKYAACDLKYLPVIHKQQIAKAKQIGIERTIDIEMKCLPAMVWLELSGFKVDADLIKLAEIEATQSVKETEQYILRELQPCCDKPLNLNSTTQLLPVLQARGFELEGTDEDSLAKYNGDPLIKNILEYRGLNKFLNTYILTAYDSTDEKGNLIRGYIHPDERTYATFNQYGTETGRLSSGQENIKKLPIKSLNLQNQPRRKFCIVKDSDGKEVSSYNWRDVFCAEKGHKLVVSDYSQIEPRIMAQVSGDPKMIAAYKEGKDLYILTAEAIFGIPYDQITKDSKEREIAKQITLGLCYGLGVPGLIKKLKTDSNIDITKAETSQYIRKFKESYPVVSNFLYHIGKNAVKDLMVRNACGRVRKFLPVRTDEEWKIINQAKNAVIQSLSADITKIAMGTIFLLLEPRGIKFCNTVHDEIIVEAPEEIAEEVKTIVEEEMIKAAKIFLTDVPCKADPNVCDRWKK